MVLVSSARANGGTNGAKAHHNGQYEEPRRQLIHNPINATSAVVRYMIITRLRPLHRPSHPKQHPGFSLNTSVIDDSPVRRYSSGQKKRWFKFPIHDRLTVLEQQAERTAGLLTERHPATPVACFLTRAWGNNRKSVGRV